MSTPPPWDQVEPPFDDDEPLSGLVPDPDGQEDLYVKIAVLQATVDNLTNLVASVATSADPTPVPAPTRDEPATSWGERASAKDWGDLADWVDWLLTTYEATALSSDLPRCWPAHTGLVEELAALHSGWKAAQAITTEAPSDAVTVWHDRSLWPLIARLKAYQTSKCRTTTHTSPTPPAPTDRSLIVVAATGETGPGHDWNTQP